MGVRFGLAKVTGAALTWGLRDVLGRSAGNMPGKMALYVDPALIGHLRSRLQKGSIVVVGTNGKTTVTNLVADAIEASGQTVMCNRGGANLDSGVATTMLQSAGADWGVFESDELWLARILPQLQADYVVLLNLFRDQEDRMGGIERIRESIVGALAASPNTTLIYTADDPQCAAIAAACENPRIAVGVGEDMGLARLGAEEAAACTRCGAPLTYGVRQYDQLGDFCCEACGFTRPELGLAARRVRIDGAGLRFAVAEGPAEIAEIAYAQGAAYLIYNLLSAFVAARATGVSAQTFQDAASAFNPKNGRLQRYEVQGRSVLLNLAKNPTGMNENIRLVLADGGPKAVAFFVNDKEGDGRDISWLEEVAFEVLADSGQVVAFAGGLRRDDLAARLERAGLSARVVEGIEDVLAALPETALPADAPVYAIANYTALPEVKAVLDRL
ncbi:MAG: DUF1727 domain-containing protein [Eggerthellaceae bacterium]|nr:DUF1727 domain-containing protein [Eggerthellaceae bacterium]